MKYQMFFSLLFLLLSGFAHANPAKQFTAKTQDGLLISAQEWGNPKGKEVVFIHGMNQAHLSFKHQYQGELAKEFRILTYDLRGHGNSSKPVDLDSYAEGKRWGDELNSVIVTAGFKNPILVGWSLGGTVIENYLKTYGDANIAGIVFIDAVLGYKPEFFQPGQRELTLALKSDDLETRSRGTVDFLKACFFKMPTQDELDEMLAFNGMTAFEFNKALQERGITFDESGRVFKSVQKPVLIIHGEHDRFFSTKMSRYGQSLFKNSKLSIYKDSGHSPFIEEVSKFNSELALFVRTSK